MNLLSWIVACSLVVWRVTSLLYDEKPFQWLRALLGIIYDKETDSNTYPQTWLGTLWACFWCLSLPVAAIVSGLAAQYVHLTWQDWLLLWLANSAGAIWFELSIRRYIRR